MFKGFSGYIQADAKSVYDALFREPEKEPPDGEAHPVRHEVACWVHARRGLWEATAAKSVVAREDLARIGRMFFWRSGKVTLREPGSTPSTGTGSEAGPRSRGSTSQARTLTWARGPAVA